MEVPNKKRGRENETPQKLKVDRIDAAPPRETQAPEAQVNRPGDA
jgi:hypothetical protein